MSIKASSHVWNNSQHGGGTLLILLALADFADDEGFCWPSVETLATKARMSERNARYILRSLEASGEIATTERGGRHGTNGYRIVAMAPGTRGAILAGGQPTAAGGGKTRHGKGQPIAPEPSRTIIEPSESKPLGAKAPGVRKPSPWSSLVDQILSDYGVAASKSNCSLAGKVVANAQANGLQPEDAAREWASWMAVVRAEDRLRFVPLHKAANAWSAEWLLGERRRDSEAIVIEGGIL